MHWGAAQACPLHHLEWVSVLIGVPFIEALSCMVAVAGFFGSIVVLFLAECLHDPTVV